MRAKKKAPPALRGRARIALVHIEGEGDAVVDALRRFIAGGFGAQAAIDHVIQTSSASTELPPASRRKR